MNEGDINFHIGNIQKVVKKEKSATSVWLMLLIQEMTHWEMSIKQVTIPDQALEFQQCVHSRGFEKITSAPPLCVCVFVKLKFCWCVVCQVS